MPPEVIGTDRRRWLEQMANDGTGRILMESIAEDRFWLQRIDEVGRAVQGILPMLGKKEPAYQDPIRYLAAKAQEAWSSANGGRAS